MSACRICTVPRDSEIKYVIKSTLWVIIELPVLKSDYYSKFSTICSKIPQCLLCGCVCCYNICCITPAICSLTHSLSHMLTRCWYVPVHTSFFFFFIAMVPPAANNEYYKLLMCNGLEERKDATVCSLEQLESITSEHTLKNTVRPF